MSVGCTTSRNLSEALSCRRRMAEAVSNKAIPFSAGTDEAFFAESLLRLVYKIILVVEEKEPGNPPHVIVPVGVVKLHGPPLFLRRKASQHQQTGVAGKEGF